MSLTESFPLPRVGQSVKLHTGKRAKVIAVYRANAVLKMMTEVQALGLSTNARARFGENWRDVYYHADVMYESGVMDTIDTSKVESVFDSP